MVSGVTVSYAPEYVLFRFTCGHVGRDNESDRPKARAFIRLAEVRMMPVVDKPTSCPDCKR